MDSASARLEEEAGSVISARIFTGETRRLRTDVIDASVTRLDPKAFSATETTELVSARLEVEELCAMNVLEDTLASGRTVILAESASTSGITS